MTNEMLLEDLETSYWNVMNEETKELCQRTIDEVIKLMPKDSKVSLLTEISSDICTKICEMEGVRIDENLLPQANTPMALAKYLRIVSDDMKITEKVKEDLGKILSTDKFDWYVSSKLDNMVFITNKSEVNSEDKPKSLSLKYKYDPDNDSISYALLGQSWNWEISKNMLLMILNNETPVAITKEVKETKVLEQTGDIELKVGDVLISIKRK